MRHSLFRRFLGSKTDKELPDRTTEQLLQAEKPKDILAVFDARFYENQVTYGLDELDDCSLLRDYQTSGFMHGFDPSPLFKTQFVQHFSRVIHPADPDPLGAWLATEQDHGPDPHPIFDCSFYRQQIGRTNVNPLFHYLTEGISKGLFISDSHRQAYHIPQQFEVKEGHGLETAEFTLWEAFDSSVKVGNLVSLSTEEFGLVSFDIWDTLLARARHPESGKLQNCLRLRKQFPTVGLSAGEIYDLRVTIEDEIGQKSGSGEYALRDVVSNLLRHLAQTFCSEMDQVGAELAEAEVLSEALAAIPRPEVVDYLRQTVEVCDRVVIFSDHYFSASDLTRVLELAGLSDLDVAVFSSADVGMSKSRGTAFDFLTEVFGDSGEPGPRLHVGDNAHADVNMAINAGFKSLQVGRGSCADLSSEFRDFYNPRDQLHALPLRDGAHRLITSLEQLASRSTLEGRSNAYADGVFHSLLPVSVVLSSIDAARSLSQENVFYLGREGHFLAQVHSRLFGSSHHFGVEPKSIDISRRSTFPAALAKNKDAALHRVSSQYRTQTTTAFLRMLGVESNGTVVDAALACDLRVDEVIDDISTDPRIKEFLTTGDARNEIDRRSEQQLEFLDQYLSRKGLRTDGGEPAVVCDIGWRGTVQDLLAIAFPTMETHGVYLGLFPLLAPNAPCVYKNGVAFDGNAGDPFSYVDPPAAIEGPWTALRPSPIGYFRARSGVVTARHGTLNPHHTDSLVRDFQAGVLDSVRYVADLMDFYGLDPRDLKWLLAHQLERFYTDPPGSVCDIWFEQEWDESFGSGLELPYRKDRPNKTHLRPWLDLATCEEALASRWPAGWLNWSVIRKVSALRGLLESAQ